MNSDFRRRRQANDDLNESASAVMEIISRKETTKLRNESPEMSERFERVRKW